MEDEKQSEKDYTEFVNLLNKHKVDYLVVGGYAVMFHTLIPRETKDIDFWIRPTKDNAEKCSEAIKEFCGMEFKKEDLLEKGAICYIGAVPNRIDIFNEQGQVDFEKAWEKRKDDKYWEVNVHFVSREDLIILKRYADREQDRKDLKRLTRQPPKDPK
jgi:predicted nucleotidyltransferase